MIEYVLRRFAQLVPVLLLASLGIWAMIYAVPGGPVGVILGDNATPEQVAALTRELGLDRPLIVQYLSWLGKAVVGDLGNSLYSREPVLHLILQRLPATLQLAVSSLSVALLIGIPVAIASALYPNSWVDRILGGWNALALGVPTFWMGILLILVFAVTAHWLPSASAFVPLWQNPLQAIRHLALPSLTLGIYVSGILARFLRASLVTELRSDYVRTARSKGLSERSIMSRHVLRNALLPFITVLGLIISGFVGGAVVTEEVFTYPGIGRLLVSSIATRDYPLIQGCVIVILLMYVLINLVVDITYVYADPRISYEN